MLRYGGSASAARQCTRLPADLAVDTPLILPYRILAALLVTTRAPHRTAAKAGMSLSCIGPSAGCARAPSRQGTCR